MHELELRTELENYEYSGNGNQLTTQSSGQQHQVCQKKL